MDENKEKMQEESYLKSNNKKSFHERNKASNKVLGISSSNIHLNFITEDVNINKPENDTTLINNMKENRTISESDFNVEICFNNIQKRREEEEEKERQLVYLYNKFYNSYKSKNYEMILVEIENIKNLLNNNSQISSKIYLLKICCLLKSVKEQYVKLIVVKGEKINLIDLLKKLSKIKREFIHLSEYLNPYNNSIYEEITHVYAKFLLYLSIIFKLKEEYIKSMTYITMGVNLMKIFFIRRKVALNIKTYMLYCELLLILINYLIGDYNYTTASFYCQILFRVLNATYKIIIKKKLPKKYYIKFLEFTGLNFLFSGVCLEQNEDLHNYETCYSAYKQANYFLRSTDKNIKLSKSFIQAVALENNEKHSLVLSQILVEKYQNIFAKEKSLKKIIQKKKIEINVLKDKITDEEKIENKRNEKYKPIEDKIYNNILTPNTRNHIEKLDNELISVVYQQKNELNMDKTTISPKSKKFLYNFELYNILMSNHFRNYIMKNNKLQFNNPVKEKQSIESLQRYLNKNIKINDNSYLYSYQSNKRNSINLNDNSLIRKNLSAKFMEKSSINNQRNITLKKNIIKKDAFKNKSFSSQNIFSLKNIINNNENSEKKKEIDPFVSSSLKYNKEKKFIFERNSSKKLFLTNRNSEMDTAKTINFRSQLNNDYFQRKKKNKKDNLFNNNKFKKIKNMNSKNIGMRDNWKMSPNFRYSNSYSFLENDFERKYLDKTLLSSRYFKKISYLDSLIVKELSFQKTILKLKGNSSKMYFGTYEKDLNIKNKNIYNKNNNNKKIKEAAYNTYLILDNKANEEVKKIKLDDYNNRKEPTNLMDYPKNVFKIFDKYIKTSKENYAKRLRVYSESSKNVKRNNENRLLYLNNGIKELNYIMSYKNKQLKNFSFTKKIKIIK